MADLRDAWRVFLAALCAGAGLLLGAFIMLSVLYVLAKAISA